MPDILKKLIKRLVTDVGTNNAKIRDQWIKKALARLPVGTRLLDAGAGTQRYRSFCSHLHYVSQDFCEYNGKGDGLGMQTGSCCHSRRQRLVRRCSFHRSARAYS